MTTEALKQVWRWASQVEANGEFAELVEAYDIGGDDDEPIVVYQELDDAEVGDEGDPPAARRVHVPGKSAFLEFVAAHRQAHKAEFPDESPADFARAMKRKWLALQDVDKAKFAAGVLSHHRTRKGRKRK